jgi:Ran GTPase-activating protein (RanGAP) involved in mRNA processing and transport
LPFFDALGLWNFPVDVFFLNLLLAANFNFANPVNVIFICRSGYMLKDTVNFAEQIEAMMRQTLGVDLDEQVEEEPEIAEEEPNNEEEEEEEEVDDEEAEEKEEQAKDESHDEL